MKTRVMETTISSSSGCLKESEMEVIEVMDRISELSKRIICIENFFYNTFFELLPFLEKQYGNNCLDLAQPPLESFSSDPEKSDERLETEEQYNDNLQVNNCRNPVLEPSNKEISDIFGDTRLRVHSTENSPVTSNFLSNMGSTLVTCGSTSSVGEKGRAISQFSNEWSRSLTILTKKQKIIVDADGNGSCKDEEILRDGVSSTSEICKVNENFLENMNIPIKAIPPLAESCIDVLNEQGLHLRAHSVVSCDTETEKLDKSAETDIFEGNCSVSPCRHLSGVPRKYVSHHDVTKSLKRSIDRSKNPTLIIQHIDQYNATSLDCPFYAQKEIEANNDQTAITQVSHNLSVMDDSNTQTIVSSNIKNSRLSHKSTRRAQDLSHRDFYSCPELLLSETTISDTPNLHVKCKNFSAFSKIRPKKSFTPPSINSIEKPCHGATSNDNISTPRDRSSPRSVSESIGSNSQRLVTLLEAAADGNIPQVRRLLSQGTPVDVENENGDQPLHVAARNDHLPVMVVLLRNGAPVNVANKSGDLPLLLAVERGHLSLVKLLVTKYGADVNAKGAHGRTALELAVAADDEKIVKFLRDNEASGE